MEVCEQGDPTPKQYQMRVRGALDPLWSAWFEGLTIAIEANGDTTLTGPVADQATLDGLISRARDLGLTLLAISCLSSPDGTDGGCT
jgi:hypothetical protein